MLKSNISESADRFNRNIMGCKEYDLEFRLELMLDLIGT